MAANGARFLADLIALCQRWMSPPVTNEAIRMEILSLGARHRGEPLDGAILELKATRLDPGRSRLLRAVVERLTRQGAAGATSG